MKNRLIAGSAIFTMMVLAGAFSISVQAQTTEPGPGPSEQPNAPMEMGQGRAAPPAAHPPQPGPPPQPGQPQGGQPPQLGEEPQPGGPSGEGPAKTDQGVGRISMTHGDVSTQRGDSGTWSAAVLNQPVMNGDKVSTGPGGRAEVQLDYANILRLGSNAQANIANFTHKYIQIQLGQGLANYSVFNESEAEPEIDTPNVALHPAHKDGVFRIEVRPDGDSIIIVRKGEAQISTPQGIADLKQGDMATVRGSGGDAKYKISAAPERDDWDRWNSDRDRMIHEAAAWHHTNKYYVGSEDLDANGTWENAPDYGQVWVPNEPEGWAPYRDGNWVGSLITVGRGLAMSPGVGRHITMVAGCGTAVRGRGGRDRCGVRVSIVHSGRRRMYRSLVSEADGALALVSVGVDGAALAGCRLGRVTASSRGGVDTADGSARSVSTDLARSTGLAGLLRCTRAPSSRTWRTSTMRTSGARFRRWLRVSLELAGRRRWQLPIRS